ncbi:MAG: MFS transporter [Bacilli bacterium]|nr:MFS transporter [Bacilli bacterium]
MSNESKSLGARRWFAIILIGLFGQIAWAIENNFINLWVYSQSHDASHITWMTAASAVVATLTTFFIGALSDKLGKRKIFIALGYTIWGVTVFLFGVMSLTNMQNMAGGDLKSALILIGVMNVLVDCLMTFFGSTANDAAFNAYVTDETNEKNRPLVESILSVMPLFALAVLLGVGMGLGIPGTQGDIPNVDWANQVSKPWLIFFLIFGIATTVVGIVSFFLLPKDHIEPNREDHYFKHMVKGFFPKTVKAHPLLYIALLAFLCFNIGVDSFMPYILVYMQNLPFMGHEGMDFIMALGIIFGIATFIVVLVGALLNKIGKIKVLFPAIGVMFGGALALFLVADSSFAGNVAAGTALIAGYLVGTTALGALIRDFTPENDVGAFQSVRMVFVVMIPMVVGSNLSLFSFQTEEVYDPATGTTSKTPDRFMFIVTMAACLLAIAPTVWLAIRYAKENKIQSAEV